jgi:hypothetical protein
MTLLQKFLTGYTFVLFIWTIVALTDTKILVWDTKVNPGQDYYAQGVRQFGYTRRSSFGLQIFQWVQIHNSGLLVLRQKQAAGLC